MKAIAEVCVSDTIKSGMTHFLYQLSPNTCRFYEASNRIMRLIKKELKYKLTNKELGEILLCSTSKALTEMPRSDPDNMTIEWQTTISKSPSHVSSECLCGQLTTQSLAHAANRWMHLVIILSAAKR